MEWNKLEPAIIKIRGGLLNVFEDIEKKQDSILPAKNEEIDTAYQLIRNETFDVLVCGEVKKGKSSFINAIIGEEILPTNTNVATSQVFRITNTEEKSYSIVFTDGTSLPITREQLSLYGSQVDADLYGEPIFEHHTLDYIQVNYPIAFLPKYVTLVDTPGIGALYAAHERITSEYLKKASAVIFVMDPANPLVEPEKQFLEKAFSITNQIMFVMTKMDNYDESYIVQMVRRNEELLQPFRDRVYNKHIQVFPMSSKTLAEAAHEECDVLKEDSLNVSQFKQVEKELLRLIYSTVGVSRNLYAFNVANAYNTQIMSSITEQTKVLSSSPDLAKELIEKKQDLQNAFVRDWGSNGIKQKEIIKKVNERLTGFQNQVTALFLQDGRAYSQFMKEIDALDDADQDEAYGKTLPSRLQTEIGQSWKGLLAECQNGIQKLLVQYDREAKLFVGVSGENDAEDIQTVIPFSPAKVDFFHKFNQLRNGYFTALFASAILGILTVPVAGWVLLPVALIVTLFTSRKEKHRRLQTELKKCLLENFVKMHHTFVLEPISAEEPVTMVQKVISEVTEMSQNTLTHIYEQQKKAIENEIAQLNEQIRKEGEERKVAKQNLENLKLSWKPVYQSLSDIRGQISEIIESLKSE